MKNNKSYIKRFYKEIFIKGNRKVLFTILLFSIVKIFVVMIIPIITMKILDEAIPAGNVSKVIIFALTVLILTIAESLLNYFLSYTYSKFSKKIFIEFQERCLKHLFVLSGDFYTNKSSGDLFTTINQDVGEIKALVSDTVFDFVTDVVIAIFMLFYLLYLQWDLLLILCVILPVLYITQSFFQKQGKKKAEMLREGYGNLNGILENVITNITPVIFSNAQEYFTNKYKTIVEDATDNEVDIRLIFSKNSGVLNFLSTLFSIIVLGYGGTKVILKAMSIGELIAFNLCAQRLVSPILNVSSVLIQVQSTLVSLEKVYKFLDTLPIAEVEDKNVINIKSDNNMVCFDKINFSYNDTNENLNDINLTFMPNKLNVIVGESGCGKSTLLSLLFRFWELKNGKILINNLNINKYGLDYLRNNISVISQDMYLFDDTVFNNIVLEQKKSIQEVKRISKIVCIHDYIMNLPNGYDTLIGEKGVKLSGGEKQRICLARALIRENSIIILDEATSALDQLIEKQVISNMNEYSKNKTIIMITHRLQSITEADCIFVINKGNVIAQGRHEELLLNCTYYRKLYERIG